MATALKLNYNRQVKSTASKNMRFMFSAASIPNNYIGQECVPRELIRIWPVCSRSKRLALFNISVWELERAAVQGLAAKREIVRLIL